MKSSIYYIDRPTTGSKNTGAFYGNYKSLDAPLVVNCASCCNTYAQHTNINKIGRVDYYLIYLISGKLDVNTPSGQGTINEGEMIVIPPGQSYKIWCSGETVYFLAVHFTGTQVEKLLSENGILLFPNKNCLNINNHIQLRFKSIFEAFAKDDEFRERELAILLERLFIEAGRAIKNHSKNVPLSKSIRFLNENFTEQVSIPELAKLEAMCLTVYNKSFKRQTGTTPSKYIIELRMRMAIHLLETSNLSIREISSTCGYPNFNFFARLFKRHTGLSPSKYRKSLINS
ncbi:MAG: helix-turn-helix transcriptional regulator [Clostridia bacterium]|nr:helix-turn-helix transcriptional regulator [Clostridia bacterium]